MSPNWQSAACALLLLLASTCVERSSAPEEEALIPDPTSPANVLMAIEQLYEDTDIEPEERSRLFATLLAPAPGDTQIPAFTFRYGMCDIECPWSGWGYPEEVSAHEAMFSQVYRMELKLNASPAYDYTNDPDRHGWRVIYSPGVTLRVWVNEAEFMERQTNDQIFVFAPAAGRWYLAEWEEYRSAAMWGDLKAQFIPPSRPSGPDGLRGWR